MVRAEDGSAQWVCCCGLKGAGLTCWYRPLRCCHLTLADSFCTKVHHRHPYHVHIGHAGRFYCTAHCQWSSRKAAPCIPTKVFVSSDMRVSLGSETKDILISLVGELGDEAVDGESLPVGRLTSGISSLGYVNLSDSSNRCFAMHSCTRSSSSKALRSIA